MAGMAKVVTKELEPEDPFKIHDKEKKGESLEQRLRQIIDL